MPFYCCMMTRRSLFKRAALCVAGFATSKVTPLEAQAACEDIPAPKPLAGNRAYVTTVKGSSATIRHNLNSPTVFVVAACSKGLRSANVDYVDRNTITVHFAEPGFMTFLKPKLVYRVVVSA